MKQNRSTERCPKIKRSEDITSSGMNGLKIRTHASPENTDSRQYDNGIGLQSIHFYKETY